ncbi:outer membrane protein assembly factor BamB family protein [Halosimplex carlsbadense]|uniref:outer membrane protein assembly factor BamB family protein n=1 Tax=Halosimplex carlsbadense TaxID=171164 RepID=UPI000677E74D|nr:PQQ-binding-like beta-propeller repeat protein [Halosimplex carlsbadense]
MGSRSTPEADSNPETVTPPRGDTRTVTPFTGEVTRSLVGEFGRINTVAAGDTTYYLGGPDAVRRLTPDGGLVWATDLDVDDNDHVATVTVGDSLVLCAVETYGDEATHARLVALDRETGAKRWEFRTQTQHGESRLDAVGQVSPELIFAGTDGGYESDGGDESTEDDRPERLYAIDAETGDGLWTMTDFAGKATFGGIFAFRNEPYVLYNHLYKIDAEAGRSRHVVAPGSRDFSGGVRHGELLYLTGETVQAYNMVTGSVRWETDRSAMPTGAMQVGTRHLFVATEDGTVAGLRTDDGRAAWRVTASEPVLELGYGAGLVWILGESGTLQAVRADDGSIRHDSTVSNAVDAANGFRSLYTLQDTVLVDDGWAQLFRVSSA